MAITSSNRVWENQATHKRRNIHGRISPWRVSSQPLRHMIFYNHQPGRLHLSTGGLWECWGARYWSGPLHMEGWKPNYCFGNASAEVESTMHAIRDCIFPQHLWKIFLPPSRQVEFWNSTNPYAWTAYNLLGDLDPELESYWKYVFTYAVQDIWHWRNLRVFQRRHAPPPDIVCGIYSLRYITMLVPYVRARDLNSLSLFTKCKWQCFFFFWSG